MPPLNLNGNGFVQNYYLAVPYPELRALPGRNRISFRRLPFQTREAVNGLSVKDSTTKSTKDTKRGR